MPSLKSVPVWVWAFVYLVSIPVFAFIYWSLPGNQFYHSTVQYEQSLQLDAGDLLEQVRSTVVANFREANHGDTTEFNGWKLNITELQVYALRPTIDRIGIKMSVNVAKATSHGPIFETFLSRRAIRHLKNPFRLILIPVKEPFSRLLLLIRQR